MLIECPSCHTRVKLPDSKEGAKVRCPECSRIYVARVGGHASSGGPSTGLLIGIAAAVLALVFLLIMVNVGGDQNSAQAREDPTPTQEPTPPDEAEISRWNAPVVKVARDVHRYAYEGPTSRLQRLLAGERVWEARKAAGDELAASFEAWGAMSQFDRSRVLQAAAEDLSTGADKGLVADWKPTDGEVVEEESDRAIVHLSVAPRPGTEFAVTEQRTVRYELVREEGRWLVAGWSRYQSPEELAALSRGSTQGGLRGGMEKVELSDGSVVIEKQPEPLGHLPDTHPDIAAEIDRLIPILLDLDLPPRKTKPAREAIIEIGRPAIPLLLTVLYETPLDTHENALRVNIVVHALRDITGESFGFKPQVAEGSGTGTTEERRQSAIKQWFAWWYRNADRFQVKEVGTDALEDLIQLTPEEKDWLRRHGEDVD
jgi:predicted Zn finger-like uncharacterized protein